MPLIQWSGALYIDHQEINNQHFKFVTILNELYESLLWSDGEEMITTPLAELAEYANNHFMYEEEIMLAENSPFKKEHTAEHEVFRQKILAMKVKLNNGVQTVDPGLSACLNGWMVNHIQLMDRATFNQIKKGK